MGHILISELFPLMVRESAHPPQSSAHSLHKSLSTAPSPRPVPAVRKWKPCRRLPMPASAQGAAPPSSPQIFSSSSLLIDLSIAHRVPCFTYLDVKIRENSHPFGRSFQNFLVLPNRPIVSPAPPHSFKFRPAPLCAAAHPSAMVTPKCLLPFFPACML